MQNKKVVALTEILKSCWRVIQSPLVPFLGAILFGLGLLSLAFWVDHAHISVNGFSTHYVFPQSKDAWYYHMHLYLIPLGVFLSLIVSLFIWMTAFFEKIGGSAESINEHVSDPEQNQVRYWFKFKPENILFYVSLVVFFSVLAAFLIFMNLKKHQQIEANKQIKPTTTINADSISKQESVIADLLATPTDPAITTVIDPTTNKAGSTTALEKSATDEEKAAAVKNGTTLKAEETAKKKTETRTEPKPVYVPPPRIVYVPTPAPRAAEPLPPKVDYDTAYYDDLQKKAKVMMEKAKQKYDIASE